MTLPQWFTYEGRCLLCGQKLTIYTGANFVRHLDAHVREGYLQRNDYEWVKIKEHPVGFPGPALGERPA